MATAIDPFTSTSHHDMKSLPPHSELSPPPSPRHEQKDAHSKAPTGPRFRFASHLTSIPIISDTTDLLSSYTPRAVTFALNTANNLAQTYIPPTVLTRADKIGDTLLTQLEHSIPAISTPTSRLTSRPKAIYNKLVTQPLTFLSTAANIYTNAGKQHTATAAENLTGIYKQYGEPLIARYTNEPIGRINNRFEGAVETGMPKSYSEAIVEERSGGAAREKVELYRSVRLAKQAIARGRVRFWVPMRNMADKTCEDVRDGGGTIKSEVRNSPQKMREGTVYLQRVVDEEMRRERAESGGKMGVKNAGKVMYRVGERCAGEIVGVGLVIVAKGMGLLWGIWGLGKDKVKTA